MKQVKLSNKTILEWLNSINTKNIELVNPNSVFKNYRPLDRGNSKLNSNILSFSLLPVVTCQSMCKGCYDVKSMRYESVRKKRYVNTSMAIHNQLELSKLIIKQVLNSKSCEYVRIHVGGDFFSDSYVSMWQYIIGCIHMHKPQIKFYTYTKTDYTSQLESVGINVVKSIYDKNYNFGSLEYVQDMAKKHKGIVCPATVRKVEPKFCGNKCKACMTCKNVFFKIH